MIFYAYIFYLYLFHCYIAGIEQRVIGALGFVPFLGPFDLFLYDIRMYVFELMYFWIFFHSHALY